MGQMLSEVWGMGKGLMVKVFRGKARTCVGQVMTSGVYSQWLEGPSGSALPHIRTSLSAVKVVIIITS